MPYRVVEVVREKELRKLHGFFVELTKNLDRFDMPFDEYMNLWEKSGYAKVVLNSKNEACGGIFHYTIPGFICIQNMYIPEDFKSLHVIVGLLKEYKAIVTANKKTRCILTTKYPENISLPLDDISDEFHAENLYEVVLNKRKQK